MYCYLLYIWQKPPSSHNLLCICNVMIVNRFQKCNIPHSLQRGAPCLCSICTVQACFHKLRLAVGVLSCLVNYAYLHGQTARAASQPWCPLFRAHLLDEKHS